MNEEQLEDLGLDRDEARAVAVHQGGQARTSESRICTDYLTTVHPDTGLEVTYVPGEALPDFALAVQQRRNAPPVPEPVTFARPSIKVAMKADPKP